jgi:integrase
MELGSDTSRALNAYLASRQKDTRRYSRPGRLIRVPSRASSIYSTRSLRLLAFSRGRATRIEATHVTPHALPYSVAYRMLHEEGKELSQD